MSILVADRKSAKHEQWLYVLCYSLQVLLEGGSYLFNFCFIAGLIRMRALFEGESYSRIYGNHMKKMPPPAFDRLKYKYTPFLKLNSYQKLELACTSLSMPLTDLKK